MPQKSPIEWTDFTSNPIYVTRKEDGKRGWHCNKPSAGCGHCYAEAINKRFGTGLNFADKNAELLDFHINEKEIVEIIALNNRLVKRNETAKLFAFDMTDLFLKEHSDKMIDIFFATAALCPNITFQILTKCAERMEDYIAEIMAGRMYEIAENYGGNEEVKILCFFANTMPNVWFGVSAENQEQLNKRVPFLLQTPAAVRFVSIEPMLSRINFRPEDEFGLAYNFLTGKFDGNDEIGNKLDWLILGGESGSGARPFNLDRALEIVLAAKAANVPVFMKQLGKFPVTENVNLYDFPETVGFTDWGSSAASVRVKLKNGKGGDFEEFPAQFKYREFPK